MRSDKRKLQNRGYSQLRKGLSLTLYAPKGKAEANSLTNGQSVLPWEDRATLESDRSAPGSPSRGDTRLKG